MLKSLDVLIGVAALMFFFSLCVMLVTQGVVQLMRLRPFCLKSGVAKLLQQVWPTLQASDGKQLAAAVLSHPMVSTGPAQGSVVHREELFFLLLEFAANESPLPLPDDLRQDLVRLLAQSGIPDPAATLMQTRELTQQLEAARPDLSAAQQKSMAILATSSSYFLSKLFGWFDQTIDRVSTHFTGMARIVTLASAVLIAGLFQLDSIWVVQRLTTDDAMRQALVADAQAAKVPSAAGPAANGSFDQAIAGSLTQFGLVRTPFEGGWVNWKEGWTHWHTWVGCLFSAVLLTLGAPFWFGLLESSLRLRSVLAGKDDVQRAQRQTSDPGPDAGGGTPPAPAPAMNSNLFDTVGERGDLAAIG